MIRRKSFLNVLKVDFWEPMELLDLDPGDLIFSLNMEQVVCAFADLEFQERLNSAQVILPDGISVVLVDNFFTWLGLMGDEKRRLKKITGIDLAEQLLKKYQNIAIIGSKEQEIEKLRVKFAGQMIYSHHGFLNSKQEQKIFRQLEILQPTLLIIGMGSPRQEKFACNIKAFLPNTIIIVVGGALDIWSDSLSRAPILMRKFNLEWLFRISQEPSRLIRFFNNVRKYVYLLLKFLVRELVD